MESCLLTCPKLQRSEVPLITNKEEYDHFMVALTERVFLPQADRQFRPRLVCCSVWLTLSDSGEEGVWRDYFTNQTAPQVREDFTNFFKWQWHHNPKNPKKGTKRNMFILWVVKTSNSDLTWANGGEKENCLIVSPIWETMMDHSCAGDPEHRVSCACR